MQSVLITGATGMIGANLTRRLLGDGYRVSVLVRPNSDRVRLQAIEKDLQFIVGDLTNDQSIFGALDQAEPDIVYHLASTPFNPPTYRPYEHYRVNVFGTLSLIEALKKSPQTRIVYTGTAAVYGPVSSCREDQALEPSTILGASKAAATLLLQASAKVYGIHTTELRLFMPYGPWEHPRRLVPQAILAALDGQDLLMSTGEQERDLIYVDDVVDALILAASSKAPSGSVFNIGSGIGTPIKNIAEMIFRLVGTNSQVQLGALPMRRDEIMAMSANIHKAGDELEWKPRTSLEQGLRQTITWIRQHSTVVSKMNGISRLRAA